ncbi:uncharacterized protein LOC119677604 [Teleopsis dalmanni]|uniref:uncharacterized protein LOC119663638 n=1 Tax=Teleopsis dalmanni TaxID=139649 RepID=UPI0018CF3E8B|nr:uncharacterized protein LOC119663638 [Teleopsis dalmanni]XP_037941311.1 uncharacterized protein LOC119674252 [Teleopsis dalmanni]XP_037941312.1 uncharacterized protein LOC119674252 [Teleopsis dalmanni]XP_037944947.1 uncharacterized protein LOC119677604 [Teleopsis dalmanni]XP_037944948.1 uncharacterized protein LOC119677604 [Teleopsis dalmanni]
MEQKNNIIKKLAGTHTATSLADWMEFDIQHTDRQAHLWKVGEEPRNITSSLLFESKTGIPLWKESQETVGSKVAPKNATVETLPQPSTSTGLTSGQSLREVRKTTGLSGAGTKWYLRYLKEGLTPAAAKEKALNRSKGSQDSKKRPAQEINPIDVQSAKKSRGNDKPLPVKNITEMAAPKQPRKTLSGSSYDSVANSLRIVILPKFYPEATLSRDEQGKIEELLIEKMYKGWDSKLRFSGIHFRSGLILIDCVDEEAAKFVHRAAPELDGWAGVELTTCTGDNIPSIYMMTVYLPRAKGVDTEKLLKLLITQNEGLHTQLWRVISGKDVKNGKLLTIGIDSLSQEAIKTNGCRVFYRFSSVSVHLHKGRVNKEGSNSAGATTPAEGTLSAAVAEQVEEAARHEINESSVKPHGSEDIDALDLSLS